MNGLRVLNSSENLTHLKFKPETVEKNVSTIGLPAGIEPIRLCDAGAMRFKILKPLQ